MDCSITFSNKFSYLSSICAECDMPSCVCNSNSQSNETEDIYLVRNNVLNQMSNSTSTSNTSFSETINMVMSEQQDKYNTNDSLSTNASMRPSSSDTGDAYLSVLSKSSNDTCVNYASLSATDISVSNQTPAEHESSHNDSTLSTGSGLSQSVSSQVSESSFTSTQDMSDDLTINQSNTNDLLDLGLKYKGFRMGHINIQGINNKIDQISLLLESEKNQIHVLGLSETKLNSLHPDSAFQVNGFQKPFRKDREINSGGGLLVYVKDGTSANRRADLELKDLECIWLEIKPKKSKPFLVGNIYRPPNSKIEWNAIFEDCIENVLKEEKEIYLMGDINRDLLSNNVKKAWSDYMEPFGLTQLISEATRVTNDSRTLLDHIYSNCPENVNSLNIPKIGLSDRFPIFCTRKMHVKPPKINHYTISYRSFKNFNEAKFIEELQSVPWDTIKLFDDTDDILEAWSDLFLQVVDNHVPIKQHRVKHKNQPQWLTPEVIDAIKCRDRYKSLGNEQDYKKWRNKVTNLIQNAKKAQYQNFIERNKENPSSIYKIFQEVGAGKGPHKQTTIDSLNSDDTPIDDPLEMANEFNEFFVNIASKLKESADTNTSHDKLKEFCQSKLPSNTKFKIPQIQKENVLKFFSRMDINKATGTDMIGPRLLKLAAPYIVGEVTFICNHSINNSIFPAKWKEAKVTPLHKSGPYDDVNNYRPISILPILSKVLEKHVHDSLSEYLQEFSLLHKTQSGFRTQHSCETALINMIDSWLNAMDKGKIIGVVLVDFKKAFDLVDHQILLNKLDIYGIKDEALMWFNTYLTNRKQQVSVNNTKSDFKQISYGVPQGSILGPLLFLLFINDLPLYTDNVSTDLYADDTTLYDIQDSVEQIESNLQTAVNNLHIWCQNNGMILNSAKTKVMLVTTNQKRQRLNNDNLDLNFNNEPLTMITNEKILGVYVDNNLTWSEHI